MNTPSSDNQPDVIVDSFRATWQAKAALPARPIATPAYRRWVGIVLGIVIAVVYGCVSHVINKLAMPGVPFSQRLLGLIGNLVIFVVSGAAISLVCVPAAWWCWPSSCSGSLLTRHSRAIIR